LGHPAWGAVGLCRIGYAGWIKCQPEDSTSIGDEDCRIGSSDGPVPVISCGPHRQCIEFAGVFVAGLPRRDKKPMGLCELKIALRPASHARFAGQSDVAPNTPILAPDKPEP
jgi:hypothetical protein